MADDKSAAATFPNYTQLDPLLPLWAWQALRFGSLVGALALAALLWLQPQTGQTVLWGLAVPLLPLVFFIAPALWRNL
jgi:hypothetical protein